MTNCVNCGLERYAPKHLWNNCVYREPKDEEEIKEAYRHELKAGRTEETFAIRCPYCASLRTDDLYDYRDYGEPEKGDEPNFSCDSCGKDFYYWTETVVTFYAKTLEAEG